MVSTDWVLPIVQSVPSCWMNLLRTRYDVGLLGLQRQSRQQLGILGTKPYSISFYGLPCRLDAGRFVVWTRLPIFVSLDMRRTRSGDQDGFPRFFYSSPAICSPALELPPNGPLSNRTQNSTS